MQLIYPTYWYKNNYGSIIEEYEHYHDVYGTDQDTISSIYPAQDAALLYEENQDCQDGN